MASTLKVDTIVHPTGTPNNLTLDNAGNVTIGNNLTVTGTTTLTTPLAVAQGGTGLTSLTAGYIPYGNGTGAFNNSANLTYSGTVLTAVGEIYASQAATNTQQIRLSPQSSGSNIIYSTYAGSNSYFPLAFNVGGSERLRIATDGSVGIGTTAPATKLQVAGGNIRIDNNQSIEWGGGNNFIIGNNSTNLLALYTNSNERVRIDSYGSLLVGTTTSPTTTAGLGTISTPGTVVMGSSFKRNRIINGDMRVDQRNAGASVTPTTSANGFPVDRFQVGVSQNSKLTCQQSTVAPTGYVNSTLITSSSAYSVLSSDTFWLAQYIEGTNISDFDFGLSTAKTITISFWVRSSLTGQFGGALVNSALNRSYPFSYTISAANTWEQKIVTITGDTTGTWLTTTGIGIRVFFNLGSGSTFTAAAGSWGATNLRGANSDTSVVGTNGATFYITGVQLEVGSIATPYERQIYSDQLAQCQRYLPAWKSDSTASPISAGFIVNTTTGQANIPFIVQPRVAPTGITISNVAHFSIYSTTAYAATNTVFSGANLYVALVNLTISGATGGQGAYVYFNNASGQLLFTGCEL